MAPVEQPPPPQEKAVTTASAPQQEPVAPPPAKAAITPSVPQQEPVTPTQAKAVTTPSVPQQKHVAPMQDDESTWAMVEPEDADDGSHSYFSPKFRAGWALATPTPIGQIHTMTIRDIAFETKDKTLKLLIERNVPFSAMQAAAKVAGAFCLVF